MKVGITGGIGSGKTTVSHIFESLGIPVFYADAAAKELMNEDEKLKLKIKELLGEEAYKGSGIDRKYIASRIFGDDQLLKALNKIVHPATINMGSMWHDNQRSPYTIKEAAVLIESGSYKHMDFIIGVESPEDLVIKRVMMRDNTSEEELRKRISAQLALVERRRYCDFLVINDDKHSLIAQVLQIHDQIMSRV